MRLVPDLHKWEHEIPPFDLLPDDREHLGVLCGNQLCTEDKSSRVKGTYHPGCAKLFLAVRIVSSRVNAES